MIAAGLAGVKFLPSIINAVLLTVVLSAAKANLIDLSQEGFAPAFLAKTTKGGVPLYGVLLTAAFGLLGFMNLSTSGSTVFNWLLNISAVAGVIL